ncbi:hypothetical protein AZE42_03770 [Rhizopogon vesiculosus]|uniref:Uncharacterized protein n=1 Tax=Rhizopogon vesiculosus TaxID=180088 RepID=A0A1J8QJ22_9AGAM|nr:hypothetical protein AZE42_03770 [Rhizopogon vesiculosus]
MTVIRRFQSAGHTISAFLYQETSGHPMNCSSGDCTLNRSTFSHTTPTFDHWLESLNTSPDVVFALDVDDFLTVTLTMVLLRYRYRETTLIRLPRADIPYSDWVDSLVLRELRTSARYFEERVGLRFNLEQTTELETLRIIQDFEWHHGDVFVHRRAKHGGLLPAVVESWSRVLCTDQDDYPEVPRHGEPENISPPETFDARVLFTSEGVPNSSTPYLSQIPCSWGAVYFPEHWREFHDHLFIRLFENVVPGVRSNMWVKSWKKYFIELVYLRGYVMLYPNYTSLSTNHLEVGAHVKDQPEEGYLRKKAFFILPLMSLPNASLLYSPCLLDLPEHVLHSLSSLPVLDLMGRLSSTSEVVERGAHRRAELTGCSDAVPTYDARALMCLPEFDNVEYVTADIP